MGLKPLIKGISWGLIGFILGAVVLAAIRSAKGLDAFEFGPTVFTGY